MFAGLAIGKTHFTLSRLFQTTARVSSVHPPLVTRLTRRATLKHLQNIKNQQIKKGKKFAFLEKHKRYPGLPGYITPVQVPALDIAGLIKRSESGVRGDYQYGISQQEIKFILEQLPSTLATPQTEQQIASQCENIHRILTISNASSAQLHALERTRVTELLQRTSNDIGSPEVQVGLCTLRIENLKKHLITNKKDSDTKKALEIYIGKRKKLLGGMRRKSLETFVRVCKTVGVDPGSFS